MKTLVEVRHAILTYFQHADMLNLRTDLELVKFDAESSELKAAVVREAMTDFEKTEIVRKISFKSSSDVVDEAYILTKPIGMWDQTVVVGYRTALSVADIINDYCKQIDKSEWICDPSLIREVDIQKLVLIIDRFAPKVQSDKQ